MHTHFTPENKMKKAPTKIVVYSHQLEIYYGFIEEMWELEYGPLKIPLFRCQWVKLPKGVFTDKYGDGC